jgi:hypothetical protein
MLRLAEVALFLCPFGLAMGWWFAGSRASRPLIWTSYVMLVVLGGSIVYYGLERALPRDAAYIPARLENGVIVSGHGAPGSERLGHGGQDHGERESGLK